MKNVSAILSSFFTIILFSCGSNKDLQSENPLQMEQAYFTSKGDSLTLYIPLKQSKKESISLDSVYFRGRQLELQKAPSGDDVYLARFYQGKKDFIMSGNPKEEFGNEPPKIAEQIPFELSPDEAVIVYTENKNKKFFKVKGIEEISTRED